MLFSKSSVRYQESGSRERALDIRVDLVERAVFRAERGDKYNPDAALGYAPFEPLEYLPHEPLCPIPLTGLAYFPACYESGDDAAFIALQVVNNDLVPGFPVTFAINKTKLTITLESP